MNKSVVKEKFKTAMNILYVGAEVNDLQLAELVKSFTMGYYEGLCISSNELQKAVEESEYLKLCHPNWQPDDSWRWWV